MNEAILDLGRKPISDTTPAGESVRSDAAFESLQAEFQKLERPDQPTVDWSECVRLASQLLGTRGKDLLVASYLAVALLERDGYDGFADGLEATRGLLDGFGETMFPERPRARRSALVFLNERGSQRVTLRGARGAQREALQAALAALAGLDELAGGKIEEGAGLFGDLRRALEDVRGELGSEPESAASGSASSASSGSFAASAAAPTDLGSADDVDQAAAAIKPTLVAMGEWLRANEPRNPLAYRLPRVALWLSIKRAPPAEGGQTQIPAPADDALSRLQERVAAQAWPGVLEETEARMSGSVFWLDPHQMAWSALRGMGPEFAAAADGVTIEVRSLLRRFPELPTLAFSDGTPLAAEATRAWIEETVLGGGDGAGAGTRRGPSISPESATFEGLPEAKAQAAGLAAEGRMAEAVRALDAGAARATRARERAAWKLALAQLCADAGRADVALAQLEALQEELQATTLERWDPELAATLVRLLLWARQQAVPPAQMNPEEYQRSRDLMRRLARLDPAAALEVQRPTS